MKSFLQLAIAITIFVPSVAIAGEETPPNTGGRAAGSRGCELTTDAANDMPSLMLLTPTQQGKSGSDRRPTFAWFVRDAASQPMIFRLYQYQANQSLKKFWERRSTDFVSQRGISLLRLPETAPALTVGQQYLWQVELVCQPDRPSSNLFAEANFLVSELPTEKVAWDDKALIDLVLRQVATNPNELKHLQQTPIHQIP